MNESHKQRECADTRGVSTFGNLSLYTQLNNFVNAFDRARRQRRIVAQHLSTVNTNKTHVELFRFCVCVCDFFKYWFLSLTDTCLHSIPWQRVSIDIERDQAPVNLAFFPNSFSECISMVAECVSPIIVVKDR